MAETRVPRGAGFVVWFTGVSGAGKSTVAGVVDRRLREEGLAPFHLDGDIVRQGLNRDLGYSDADRDESIRRISEVSRLFALAGVPVIVAAISPFRVGRERARALFEPGRFVEVHIDTPLEVAEQRDTKGLYRLAREGRLSHFTGIDSPYEVPLNPEIRIDSLRESPAQAGERVIGVLRAMNLIG